MKIKFPAVSIIIPMYNAEKYIGECLDSILAQTFPYFEIILVDDCSTDNCANIAKSYLEKFGGRLKIATLHKNSGNPSTPRNVGIEISRGEYILFIDSDDAITNTALAELYLTAKNFEADAVFYNGYYRFHGDDLATAKKTPVKFLSNMKPLEMLANPFATLLNGGLSAFPWCYLFRRDIIVQNKIQFPKLSIGEDRFFIYSVMFFAKKVFRIPNTCYYYRIRADSVSSRKIPAEELFKRRVEATLNSINFLEDFIDKHADFFSENPQAKFLSFNNFVGGLMKPVIIHSLNKKVSVKERLEITGEALRQVENTDYLTAFLLNKLASTENSLRRKNNDLKRLRAKIKKGS